MQRINETFLEEIGLGNLPKERKELLLKSAQDELSQRVGQQMCEGLTREQLNEFDGLTKGDRDVMIEMLAKIGNYETDPVYQRLLERYGLKQGNMDIVKEYLSVKWVQMNRPDYTAIIDRVADEIKGEIKQKVGLAA